MGHDDAIVSDTQSIVRPAAQEAVETDKHVFTKISLADFGPMGGYVASFEPGVDDETVLLGVGAFPKP